jgi:serine/threonine-protein kinase HipA
MSNRKTGQVLEVDLFDSFVGTITWLPTQQIVFAFAQQYLNDPARPTLSLSYRDVINGVRTKIRPTSVRLPPFFSNLLPEGKLRSYLARKANINEAQEFFLLSALKADLPGAIRLRSSEENVVLEPQLDQDRESDGPLQFSLAGVQLKLSGDLTNHKFVIPIEGTGGHWIAKLPVPALPRINELEYAMLLFAKEIGIEVPEAKLIPISEISGIPRDLPETMIGNCMVSRRFDRTIASERVHMEDFCQVFGQYDKYNPQFNYQSIASVLWTESGLNSVQEFVRRLVFTIAIGNADMHLKNWSLIYSDRKKPTLSPAYDFVPSAPIYPHTYQKLALKIAGENRFAYIDIEHFKSMAAIAKLPERLILANVKDTADTIYATWARIQNDLAISSGDRRLITEQLSKSSLMHSLKPRSIQLNAHAENLGKATVSTTALAEQMLLDQTVPEGKIVYEEPKSGRRFELEAPRRLVSVLLMEQLQNLLIEHPELNMQVLVPRAAAPLYLEWREENIGRIESRHLTQPLFEKDMLREILFISGRFFPMTFQQLEQMHELNRADRLDFILDDQSRWTARCRVRSINNAARLDDGRTFADIELSMQDPERVPMPNE